MNIMETTERTADEKSTGQTIDLPLGMLGFEQVKRYTLVGTREEEPFMWFQMINEINQSFLVVSPFLVTADYRPDISEDDVQFLDLKNPEEALLLNVVTLRQDGKATINLRGPIVINRRTLVGKQIIPNNVAQFALNHPLPVA